MLIGQWWELSTSRLGALLAFAAFACGALGASDARAQTEVSTTQPSTIWDDRFGEPVVGKLDIVGTNGADSVSVTRVENGNGFVVRDSNGPVTSSDCPPHDSQTVVCPLPDRLGHFRGHVWRRRWVEDR